MTIFGIVVFVLIVFFALIRNTVTLFILNKSVDAIRNYALHLCEIGIYNRGADYYGTMKESYFKHLFSFWKWSKYSGIRKEYRDLLRPYFK